MNRYPVAISAGLLLAGVLLAGCGKPAPPPNPAATTETGPSEAVNAAPDTSAHPGTAAAQTAGTAATGSEFDARVLEVLAAETDTDFTGALRLCNAIKKDFKGSPRLNELAAIRRRLSEEKRSAAGLAFAVRNLASEDRRAARATRDVLDEAGEAGRIFLRHSYRTKEEQIALASGRVLIEMRDIPALPGFVEKLEADPGSALSRVAAEGCAVMAESLTPDMIATCFDIVHTDVDFVATHVIDVLEAVLVRVCGTDEQNFNEAVRHPEGLHVLRQHVGRALLSTNAAVTAWACERSPATLPLLPGLRGRYYTNSAFEVCVLDRRDPHVQIGNRAFPMPENRQDDLSARWTAVLPAPSAGEFTFTLNYAQGSPQGARLWVDEIPLFKAGGPPSQTAKTTLSNGWRSIRIDYAKHNGGNGNGGIQFAWSGPASAESPVVLQTRPWPGLVETLAQAAADLNSTNHAAVRAAEQLLSSTAGLGRLFLFDVMKTDSGVGGQRAMDMLCRLAPQIESKTFEELYVAAFAEDSEAANPYVSVLCAALWRVCGNDPQKFGELVGDPAGYAKLAAHLRAALISTDKATVARACRNGYPFAPLMPGLRGQYHHDPTFSQPALQRLDGQIAVGNRQFPMATNHQVNISVEWSGALSIAQAGEYTFFAAADSYVGIYLDEGLVNSGNWAQPKKVTLEPGLHPFRALFTKNQAGVNSSVSVSWEGPGIGRQVLSGAFRSAPWDARLAELSKALPDLTSTNVFQARAARALLAEAGEVGHLYLRNAIRHEPARTAQAAAPLLAAWRDEHAPPVLLARLKTEKDAKLIVALTDALRGLAREIEPAVFPELYKAALAAGAAEMNPYASILCAALWQVCSNTPAAFGDLVADAAGHAKLDAHVQMAITSKDPAALTRACRNGYPLAPLLPGLHARYHRETYFDQPLLERQDGAINVANRQFPLATNLQDNISVDWNGWISIAQAGDYKFQPAANSYVIFYVDGQHINQGNWREARTLTLQPGMHAFRALFTQNQPGGNSDVSITWEGPGIGRQPVSGVFQCAPWDSRLAELDAAVTDLTSTNLFQARAAQTLLAQAGGVGRAYLRNLILHAPASTASAAAPLLAGWHDKDAPPVLLTRLKTEKDAKLIVALTDALRGLAREIEPAVFPELYKAALAAGAAEMNPYASILCSALWRVCSNTPAAFGELVGDAGGHAKLEAHVKAALSSKDATAMARACRDGYPLAPLMPGLRGRYYHDPHLIQLALDRLDGQVNVANRQFPLATNRQDNISAEWSSVLLVPQAGEYTFHPAASTYVGVYVDDKMVNVGNWSQPAKIVLPPGPLAFRAAFSQSQPGGASSVSVSWEGPGVARQVISSGTSQCAPWDAKLAELSKAVAGLTSKEIADVRAARTVLAAAGGVGRVYLRRAVLHEPARTAQAAASLLAQWLDEDTPPALLARLKSEKDAELMDALVDALCELASAIDPQAFPAIYKTGLAARATEMNRDASILCAALLSRHGDNDAFNKLVDDANGYLALARHVRGALESTDRQAALRACRYGAPFAPRLRGQMGRYYVGQDFLDLALEAVSPQVNVANRQFPYPDKRQDDMSARWSGFLNIDNAGDYTFIVNAHGAANVWVNNQHVAYGTGWSGEHKKDTVSLAKGLQKLRVDFWQNSGANQVQLSWIPPGGAREVIPAAVLTTPPSADILAQIEKAIPGLSSAKPEDVAAASSVLKGYGDVSLLFLKRALRKGNAVAVLAPLMMEMRDLSLVGMIGEFKKAKSPVAQKIEASLKDLAEQGDKRYAAWFYEVMKGDAQMAFPVCGQYLSKVLQEACANNPATFNTLVADPQGHVTLTAYLDKLPKPPAAPAAAP
ncbi:MAG: PA14 domain-containing protein [Verrucomicrobia bacterium]|nr:PA14 domain-containing protein [Verrucomicrobiota bacterium]